MIRIRKKFCSQREQPLLALTKQGLKNYEENFPLCSAWEVFITFETLFVLWKETERRKLKLKIHLSLYIHCSIGEQKFDLNFGGSFRRLFRSHDLKGKLGCYQSNRAGFVKAPAYHNTLPALGSPETTRLILLLLEN